MPDRLGGHGGADQSALCGGARAARVSSKREAHLTALNEYDRLESTAIWRPGPSEQRRNVVVSIGSATLTISDMADTALAHWSLPAIDRVNPGAEPAIYRPAEDAPDRLEVSDADMVAAIERVRRAVDQGRPKPGRLRGGLLAALLVGFALVLAIWMPGAIRTQAAALLPEVARQAIGNELVEEIRRITGAPCAEPGGQAALDRLAARFAPGSRAAVVPSGLQTTASLPGNVILLGRGLVEDHETPFVAARYLVEADLRRAERDPVRELLDEATLLEAARMLTTGRISERALEAHAEALLREPQRKVEDAALITRFAGLDLPAAPYAYAVDISGETVLGLIEADPIKVSEAPPPIGDSDWVALQGICGE